jgi:hypothetical protein
VRISDQRPVQELHTGRCRFLWQPFG